MSNIIGNRFTNSQGSVYEVVGFESSKKVTIKYLDDYGYEMVCTARDARLGKVKNPYHPSIYGKYFIGVGIYSSKCRAYGIWIGMLERCESRRPEFEAYNDCSVHPDWYNFQIFAEWYYQQKGHDSKGFEIDKDIIIKGNRVYGPEACCFVPRDINILTQTKERQRGKYMLGVKPSGKKYISRIRAHGKELHLGVYTTEKEAHIAYTVKKQEIIRQKAEEHKNNISADAYTALVNYRV